MTSLLTRETQELLESRLKSGNFTSAENLVRFALQDLDQVRGDDWEDLESETQEAIQRALIQSSRGKGRPWEEVRQELSQKYFGK
jgi:Arc/MetJ-type ribon-helix-helix transcriptional regulator